MCLGTNIRGGRQFNMFMSENICTMVTFSTRSEGDNDTQTDRQTERQTGRQTDRRTDRPTD